MAFALPAALWGTALAGLATVLLHLLSWRRPRPACLPTARFLPQSAPPARFRQLVPSDLLVLSLRLLAVGAMGLAVAGPAVTWRGSGIARVVVLDASAAVASATATREALRAAVTGATEVRVVAADSATRAMSLDAALARDTILRAPVASLAPVLVRAVREGNILRQRHDAVEIVVVSPFTRAQSDAAIAPIVRTWGAKIRLERVPAQVVARAVMTGGELPDAADAIGAAAWAAWGAAPRDLRLRRVVPDAGDSAFARAGGTVVTWMPGESVPGVGGALVVGDRVVVGPLAPLDGSATGEVVARWQDGRPAAWERSSGMGCLREVRVAVPRRGDMVLRPSFVAAVRALTGPCLSPDLSAADARVFDAPTGGSRVAVPTSADPRWQRALLALALLALGAEWWLRRAGRPAAPRGTLAPRVDAT